MADQERQPVKAIANGTRKDVGLDRKLRDVFVSDNAGSVGDYIVWDVIVPGFKGMIQQGLHGAIDTIFGGGGRYRGSSRYGYSRSYDDEPSYRSGRRSYATRGRYDDDRDDYRERRRSRRRYEDSEVVLSSWSEAEDVRDLINEQIDRYGIATVSDLNAATNQSDRDYTDVNWGWDDISSARIRTLRGYFPDGDGYVLELPSPIYIKDRIR